MLSNAIWLLCLAAAGARAQEESNTETSSPSTTSSASRTRTGTASEFSFTNSYITLTGSDVPTFTFTGSQYTYLLVTGQSTVTRTATASQTGTTNGTSTSTNSQITASTRSIELTQIGGSASPTNGTSNSTASSTSSAARPTNTVPCNGWPEFCTRKYSNISMITSHNSAFVVPNNAASNQELPILTQLNDGVRMLQGQVHWVNETLYNCHTSCDQLNAGTFQSELELIRGWLQDHPYDVLTMLIGNSDFTDVENFVPAFTNAGLLPYLYEPAYIPQYREQWPTLGEMILGNNRLVVFMDYDADQSRVPYILDEFSHIWETPFSPTNQSFPCDAQRPPDLNETLARDQYMYLANHNLNVAVDLSSIGIATGDEAILIPNTAELNLTNSQEIVFGALGKMNVDCTQQWDRPPNFMLVDYYNYGSPEPGSVFHVAAAANGVQYTRECCGLPDSSGTMVETSFVVMAGAFLFTLLLL
ncbi:hypothetical protein CB0940_04589 [Cercospora beticola]|uniref:Secreted protein n=1 Tax=Cercospora beticola TaxID=122368 RepID=A0A2G5HJJ4_CERBT|nr:hypothetical protein CB0940_04589 [Cercospora beticola]PIA92700.1 hypothetical protein CB0940_04589 [Cercospora beticola]WPB01842.1 hypothetical protein RHO25_006474 [Cercospora beticola]CAK1363315.1 unnamed protein product [Cercospora beticola]